MRSPVDDRTARARIRDETLRLFADRGPDALTVRDVAAAAEVSPALIMRHFGSKDGLREAVDDHVAGIVEAMLDEVTGPDGGGSGGSGSAVASSMAEAVIEYLPAGSPVPGYLGRLLVSGGPHATALFARLYAASGEALAAMSRAGTADEGPDPAARSAFLLVNDLAVLILRPRIAEVLGVDPLSPEGIRRWGAEVLSVYGTGLGGTTTARSRSTTGHDDPTTRHDNPTTGQGNSSAERGDRSAGRHR